MATRPHLPSNPPYMCVSIVKLTPCPPQQPTPVRLEIPKPMLPSPVLGWEPVRTVRSHLGRIATSLEVTGKQG